ncbi:hypothetical protein V3C99_008660 [Haemonchus contortus]
MRSGIGAVFSPRFPDGHDKAFYHASCALTPARRSTSRSRRKPWLSFSQLKISSLHIWTSLHAETDHKPLISISGSRKGVPVYTANRLRRWPTTLLIYNFNIQYVKTSEFEQEFGRPFTTN